MTYFCSLFDLYIWQSKFRRCPSSAPIVSDNYIPRRHSHQFSWSWSSTCNFGDFFTYFCSLFDLYIWQSKFRRCPSSAPIVSDNYIPRRHSHQFSWPWSSTCNFGDFFTYFCSLFDLYIWQSKFRRCPSSAPIVSDNYIPRRHPHQFSWPWSSTCNFGDFLTYFCSLFDLYIWQSKFRRCPSSGPIVSDNYIPRRHSHQFSWSWSSTCNFGDFLTYFCSLFDLYIWQSKFRRCPSSAPIVSDNYIPRRHSHQFSWPWSSTCNFGDFFTYFCSLFDLYIWQSKFRRCPSSAPIVSDNYIPRRHPHQFSWPWSSTCNFGDFLTYFCSLFDLYIWQSKFRRCPSSGPIVSDNYIPRRHSHQFSWSWSSICNFGDFFYILLFLIRPVHMTIQISTLPVVGTYRIRQLHPPTTLPPIFMIVELDM